MVLPSGLKATPETVDSVRGGRLGNQAFVCGHFPHQHSSHISNHTSNRVSDKCDRESFAVRAKGQARGFASIRAQDCREPRVMLQAV